MGIVNLLPGRCVLARKQKQSLRACLALLPLMMGGIVVITMMCRNASRQEALAFEQAGIGYSQTVAAVDRLQQARVRQSALLTQASALTAISDRVPRSCVLAAIVGCLSEDATLTRLELDSFAAETAGKKGKPAGGAASDNSDAAGQGAVVRIAGLATTNVAVGAFVSNLSRNPLFAAVELLNNQEKAGEKDVREFQIMLELRPGGPAAPEVPKGQALSTEGRARPAAEGSQT